MASLHVGQVPATQCVYKAAGIGILMVGEENYGEGASRKHAAMEPLHPDVRNVLVNNFGRINETNLKKQTCLFETLTINQITTKFWKTMVLTFLVLPNFVPASRLHWY